MGYHHDTTPFIARAEKILEGFEYVLLASGPSTEVWDCRKPGTSVYAFTISVTRRGIAVVGDIGALSFGVGAAYGLPFLAGEDVVYYIHGKLSNDLRDSAVELDEAAFRDAIARLTAAFLEERAEEVEATGESTGESSLDVEVDATKAVCAPGGADADTEPADAEPEIRLMLGDVELPSWIAEPDGANGRFTELLALARKNMYAVDSLEHGDMWDRLGVFLSRCAETGGIDEARRRLKEARSVLDAEDVWEFNVRRACSALVQNLFTVNLAAKRICAQKAAQCGEPTAVATAGVAS